MQKYNRNKSRIILLIAMVFISLCLLCVITAGSYYWFWIRPKTVLANNLHAWTPENSTPGTHMVINETGRQTNHGVTRIYYEVKAYGLPARTEFTLRLYDKLLLKESGVWSLQSDAVGELSLDRFSISNFVRGEGLVLALVSDDSKIRVYSRLFPFPIEETGDGGCHVWVELLNTRATSFAVYGEGFEPEEILDHMSEDEDMYGKDNIQVDENGRFTLAMFPEIFGKQSGTVKEIFVGQQCTVTTEFEWGLSALEIQ